MGSNSKHHQTECKQCLFFATDTCSFHIQLMAVHCATLFYILHADWLVIHFSLSWKPGQLTG